MKRFSTLTLLLNITLCLCGAETSVLGKKVFLDKDFHISKSHKEYTAFVNREDSHYIVYAYKKENKVLIHRLSCLEINKDTCILDGRQYEYKEGIVKYIHLYENNDLIETRNKNNKLISYKGKPLIKKQLEVNDTIGYDSLLKITPLPLADYYGIITAVNDKYSVKVQDKNNVLKAKLTYDELSNRQKTKSGKQYYYYPSRKVERIDDYIENGVVISTRLYEDGQIKDKRVISFFDTPQKTKDAIVQTLNSDGLPERIDTIHHVKNIESVLVNKKNTEYVQEESMPEFFGGQKALFLFLNQNVHYPPEAYEEKIQGKVIVEFVVDKDGSICDAVILKSVHWSLDEEALRVIKSMPKWKPGVQKGKPVRVKYTVPVNFGFK